MVSEIITKFNSFLLQCKRVWLILKKPTRIEFNQVAKISAIGIGVIGLFGFLIAIVLKPLFR